jgi:hypothetical protein
MRNSYFAVDSAMHRVRPANDGRDRITNFWRHLGQPVHA